MPEKMRIIFINLMCVLNSGANFEIVLLLKITLLKKFFQARVLYLSESLGSASSYFFFVSQLLSLWLSHAVEPNLHSKLSTLLWGSRISSPFHSANHYPPALF